MDIDNMKNKQSLPLRGKYATIGIILTTVILAGVAIFTALRLYQTRSQSVAPNVPSSKPKAAGLTCGGIAGILCPTGEECIYSDGTTHAPNADASGICQTAASRIACSLSFAVFTPSPSPSPTPTPTRSPSPSPTASPVPQCNTACSTASQCPSGLTCYIPNGQVTGNCRNNSCNSETDCVCATASPSPTPTPTRSPSPSPTASPVPQCNSSCTSNSNCPSSMMCNIPSGSTTGNCRNNQCLSETDCTCPVVTTPPTTNPTTVAYVPAPTNAPSLPDAGTTWPTIIGTGFGILVIIGSLLLAL